MASRLLLPVADYLGALAAVFRRREPLVLIVAAAAFVLSWWVYVPVHELAHALGCVLTGGTIWRLEIAPWYGADWLREVFPFVVSATEYSGRLSGFDTHGSDWTYLATDVAPFILTILLGVPLLRSVRERPTRGGRLFESAKLGAALPIAFAPFISLTGDYYEMGSICVSRAIVWWVPSMSPERWRSDDVFRLFTELNAAGGANATDVAVVVAGLLLGGALAWSTYAVGALWAALLTHAR